MSCQHYCSEIDERTTFSESRPKGGTLSSRLLSCSLGYSRTLSASFALSATLVRPSLLSYARPLAMKAGGVSKLLLLFCVSFGLSHTSSYSHHFFWTLVPALSWPKTVENQVYLDSFKNRPYDFDPLGGGRDKFISMLFLG